MTEDYKEGDNKFTGKIQKITIDLKEMKAANAEAEQHVVSEGSHAQTDGRLIDPVDHQRVGYRALSHCGNALCGLEGAR